MVMLPYVFLAVVPGERRPVGIKRMHAKLMHGTVLNHCHLSSWLFLENAIIEYVEGSKIAAWSVTF